MERRTFISSSSNPRLKKIRRLRRHGDGAFLVEGFRQVASALEAGVRVRELLLAPELWLGASEAEVARTAALRGADVLELGAAAFESISSHVRPDGVAAVVARWPTRLDLLRFAGNPLVLVAESVERPGNLGAIVRSACAAGADALVSADPRTDVFHPDAVRGSVGTVFKLPVGQGSTAETIALLRTGGMRIVVATPTADRSCWAASLAGSTAIVVGNERYGVSPAWLDEADETVTVPMPGPADSLNVAVAAGVVLFEAARQRSLAAATGALDHTKSLQRST